MKICMLTTSFPRFKGDYAGNFIYELAKNLVRRGVEVSVVAPHHHETKGYEMMDGIKVHRFQYFYPKKFQRIAYDGGIPSKLKGSLVAKLQLPFFLISFFIKSLDVARSCDIIHGFWAIPGGVISGIISQLLNKPNVITMYGSGMRIGARYQLLSKIIIYFLNSADYVTSDMEEMFNIAKEFGFDNKNSEIIITGVDTDIFKPSNNSENKERKIVLMVGSFRKIKGHDFVVRCIPRVLKECPNTQFIFTSDGPQLEDIKKRVEKLNVSENVVFTGIIPRDELIRLYKKADVFLLASPHQNASDTSLYEAFSAGKAVVATDVGEIRNVAADGENILLAPYGDIEAYSNQIVRILKDDHLKEKLGLNARKLVLKKYSIDAAVNSYLTIYRKLLSKWHCKKNEP
ncbi:MAG: hypothetical protein DRO95_00190 [Candidatus Altiarchaeales archaeon]|nr:MAG: hypothetical protein DRO95_00190 [Candidatus Altiarchaeales archaeon]HDO82526.1 glycosyltransferase family 4 protein [Candidatus Altiarchaeales archaeon]HEX55175.1 glycosyltransferase family 4 protein [Candidatus Altiarchaeales archaeon]